MSETLDKSAEVGERPGMLTALCILTFIGSGLVSLLGLIGIFASGWVMSLLGAQVDQAAAEAGGGAAVEAAAAEVEGAMAMGTGILIAAFVLVLGLALLSLFGAIKMWSLKKSGFIMYAIGTGLWAVICILGASWLAAVASIVFIVLYGMNLKHMK